MQNRAIQGVLEDDLKAINDRWRAHWEAVFLRECHESKQDDPLHQTMMDFYSEMAKVVKGTIDIVKNDR